jgi:hypothetical protein
MERLTINEIIEHCDRNTRMYEKACDVKYLETSTMNNSIKGYWEHKQVAEYLRKLKEYEDLEEQGRLVKLPCKVGDTVYVDNTILPIEDMECYEDIDNKIPLYFPARVVSFRFAKRNWMKIAVKAKWLHEWIDDETGPESDYIECEKNFTILLSMIGKTVFLTKSEAEEKLKELRGGENE